MKIFDSGMPDEGYWASLFDLPAILDWLDLQSLAGPIAEIGCGYGTFTIPMALRTSWTVHAFDIEPAMIEAAGSRARDAGISTVTFECRDVLQAGTGLPPHGMGLVVLFNILHSAERRLILAEASRILNASGRIAILHWRKDIPTPRGPRVDSRPDLLVILDAIAGLDLRVRGEDRILEPYHWGVQLERAFPVPPADISSRR